MNRSGPAIALASLLLASTLAGCGGKNSPAVCGSIDDLKTTIASVKDIDFTSSGALDQVKAKMSAIGDDLTKVKSDAGSGFSTQINDVQTSLDALQADVSSVVASPSAAALASVGTALSTFATSVKELVTEVQATC